MVCGNIRRARIEKLLQCYFVKLYGSWNIQTHVFASKHINYLIMGCHGNHASHDINLRFHPWLTFNNHFNEFAIIDLVENEALHNKIGFLLRK